MSIQVALQFIQLVRADPELQNKLLVCDRTNLESCVILGRELGLNFTPQELETAHKHDWGMRWAIYKPRSGFN